MNSRYGPASDGMNDTGGPDDGDGTDSEGMQDQQTDGLEIALPENADTYRLLMGEDQSENPRVDTFQQAYDDAMQGGGDSGGGGGGEPDHEACMQAGRDALEQADQKGNNGPVPSPGGPMAGKMGGPNPLNARM